MWFESLKLIIYTLIIQALTDVYKASIMVRVWLGLLITTNYQKPILGHNSTKMILVAKYKVI